MASDVVPSICVNVQKELEIKKLDENIKVLCMDGLKDVNRKLKQIEFDKKIGIIWYREELSLISDRLDNIELFDIGSRYDLKEQAHCLFGVLRNADEKSFDEIFAPLPPKEGIGLALYNRMIRAAAHQIIRM